MQSETVSESEHPKASEVQIYFNGFSLALGSGDVIINLQRNGRDVAQLNGSYTVVKSLIEKLTHLIGILERQSGQPIMSVERVAELLKREQQSEKDAKKGSA